MSVTRPDLKFDGLTVISEGMDGGRSPELLNPDQIAFAENVTGRYSYPKSRPGINKLNLLFQTADQLDAFTNGLFQGMEVFSYGNNGVNQYVEIYSIGGRIFEVNMDLNGPVDPTPYFSNGNINESIDGVVREITPLTPEGELDANSNNLPIAYMCQADTYFVIQDGQSRAILYQYGQIGIRSNPNNSECPVGTIMAYGQGRLCLVIKGNQILVGDILGGGTEVVQFTETTYLAEGGSFSLPVQDNQIRAMRFIQLGDTATGQGELVVWADNSISTFNLATDRTTWKSIPIEQIALVGVGGQGHRSPTLVNSDIWHRAPDGIRSYIQARRNFAAWQNTPLSFEVQKVLDNDDESLLQFCSGAYFDRRLLMTFGPSYNDNNSVGHAGIVALSFDNVSGLTTRTVPIWEGFWTGVKPMQIIARAAGFGSRCFIIARDCNSGNQVYELTKTGLFDNNCTPITSTIITRKMDAQLPLSKKELLNAALWAKEINGDLNLNVQYRPDWYPTFIDWFTANYCYSNKTCNAENCHIPNLQNPYVVRQLMHRPQQNICLQGLNRLSQFGKLFDFKITWTGSATIAAFQAMFRDIPEAVTQTDDCPIM